MFQSAGVSSWFSGSPIFRPILTISSLPAFFILEGDRKKTPGRFCPRWGPTGALLRAGPRQQDRQIWNLTEADVAKMDPEELAAQVPKPLGRAGGWASGLECGACGRLWFQEGVAWNVDKKVWKADPLVDGKPDQHLRDVDF